MAATTDLGKEVIPADKPWVPTKWDSLMGKRITLRCSKIATGWRISDQSPYVGPDGDGSTAPAGYNLPGAPRACVVGRFQDGEVFRVGSEVTMVGGPGVLELACNDDIEKINDDKQGHEDNDGSMSVTLTVG